MLNICLAWSITREYPIEGVIFEKKLMRVENLILYHTVTSISAEEYFDCNNVLSFNNDAHNPRNRKIENLKPIRLDKNVEKTFLNFWNGEYSKLMSCEIPAKLKYALKQIFITCIDLNNRYWERLFEDYRKLNFPELPSRLSCIYLSDEISMERWFKKASQDLASPNFAIYEVEVTGNLHEGDAAWLELDIVTDQEIFTAADNYWNNRPHPDSRENLKEFIFCGDVTIKKKYKSFNEFQQRNLN